MKKQKPITVNEYKKMADRLDRQLELESEKPLGERDDDLIEEYVETLLHCQERIEALTAEKESSRGKTVGRIPVWARTAAAAVIVLMLVFGAVWGTSAAAEAKEYREASAFLASHDIVSEGLSRQEVKAVYKDIANETFLMDETHDALEKSVIAGYSGERAEIDAKYFRFIETTRGEDYRIYGEMMDDGSYYTAFTLCGTDPVQNSGINPVGECLYKMRRGKLLWSYPLELETVSEIVHLHDGILLITHKLEESESPGFENIGLIKLDFNGKTIWKRDYSGFPFLIGRGVIEKANGEIAMVGNYSGSKTAVFSFSGLGELLRSTDLKGETLENRLPVECASFGDRIAVLLQSIDSVFKPDMCIIVVDDSGTIITTIDDPLIHIDRGDGNYLTIEDMHEFSGKLYISGSVTSAVGNAEPVCAAELLSYDPENGQTGLIESARDAAGSVLSIDSEGNLVWSVRHIEKSPDHDGGQSLDPTASAVKCSMRLVQYYVNNDGNVFASLVTHGVYVDETVVITPGIYINGNKNNHG